MMDEVEMIKFLGIMVVVVVISIIVAVIGGHLGTKKGISIVSQSSWPSWLEKETLGVGEYYSPLQCYYRMIKKRGV